MALPKRKLTPSEIARIEQKKKSMESGAGGVISGLGKYVRMLGNVLYPNYDQVMSKMEATPAPQGDFIAEEKAEKAREAARTINEGLQSALKFMMDLTGPSRSPEQVIEEFSQNPRFLEDLRLSFLGERREIPEAIPEGPSERNVIVPEEVGGEFETPADVPEEDIAGEGIELDPEAAAEMAEVRQRGDASDLDLRWQERLEEIGAGEQSSDEDADADDFLREHGLDPKALASAVSFGLAVKRAAIGARKTASGWVSPRLPGRVFRSRIAMIRAAWKDVPSHGRVPARQRKPGDKMNRYCTHCGQTTSHEVMDGGGEKCLKCDSLKNPKASSNVVVRVASELPVKDRCRSCGKEMSSEDLAAKKSDRQWTGDYGFCLECKEEHQRYIDDHPAFYDPEEYQ